MSNFVTNYADIKKSFIKKEDKECRYCKLKFRHGEALRDHESKCPYK
jgi:hypothetical protein